MTHSPPDLDTLCQPEDRRFNSRDPALPKDNPFEVLRNGGAAPSSLREFDPIVELIEERRRIRRCWRSR